MYLTLTQGVTKPKTETGYERCSRVPRGQPLEFEQSLPSYFQRFLTTRILRPLPSGCNFCQLRGCNGADRLARVGQYVSSKTPSAALVEN